MRHNPKLLDSPAQKKFSDKNQLATFVRQHLRWLQKQIDQGKITTQQELITQAERLKVFYRMQLSYFEVEAEPAWYEKLQSTKRQDKVERE